MIKMTLTGIYPMGLMLAMKIQGAAEAPYWTIIFGAPFLMLVYLSWQDKLARSKPGGGREHENRNT